MPTPPTEPATYTPCDNPRSYRWKRNICKCVACRDAASREQKRNAYRAAKGMTNKLVSAEPTINAIARLTSRKRKSRLSIETIARYVGVSSETIWSVLRGDHDKVKTSTEQKVLELASLSPADERYPRGHQRRDWVSTERALRIIHGLMLQGYPQTWIATQMGNHPNSQVSGWVRGKYKSISLENEAKLLRIAAEVGLRPGPNERVRKIARRRGYKALAEWDDLL